MNKKGGEKILSIWWFFILAVVGGIIAFSIIVFYSAKFDVRNSETEILYNRIIDCISENGFLKPEVLQENFDIFSECDFNKDSFEKEKNVFYFKIEFLRKKIETENVLDCTLSLAGQEAKHYPKCMEKTEKLSYLDGKEIKTIEVNILVASNQEGESEY